MILMDKRNQLTLLPVGKSFQEGYKYYESVQG
jgi:hypothetical protein